MRQAFSCVFLTQTSSSADVEQTDRDLLGSEQLVPTVALCLPAVRNQCRSCYPKRLIAV